MVEINQNLLHLAASFINNLFQNSKSPQLDTSGFSNLISTDITMSTPFFEGSGKTLIEVSSWLSAKTRSLEILSLLPATDGKLLFAEVLTDLMPYALALEFESQKIKAVRIYHSSWPVEGKHRVRKPFFEPTVRASVPTEISRYSLALAGGKTAITETLFSERSSVREPSGRKSGPGFPFSLKHFYDQAFRNGGIKLMYHTFAQVGAQAAAEYTVTHWGRNELTPQPGIEFWDLGPQGKFLAVRIYDDIEQPPT